MVDHKLIGAEIRSEAMHLIYCFMMSHSECQANNDGITQSKIARECGLLWVDKDISPSTQQQYWIIAALRELESKGLIVQARESGPWRLSKLYINNDEDANMFIKPSADFMKHFSGKIGHLIRTKALNHIYDSIISNQCDLSQSELFERTGLDWGDKNKAPSSKQQFWMIAGLAELVEMDRIENKKRFGLSMWGTSYKSRDEFSGYLWGLVRGAKITDDPSEDFHRDIYRDYHEGKDIVKALIYSRNFEIQKVIDTLIATVRRYKDIDNKHNNQLRLVC